MNKESKKVLRRKLIVLGIMLAVLFGSIAVAGITKRGDYLAVAHAEEANPSEWETVHINHKLAGTFTPVSETISKLTLARPSARIENGNIIVSLTFLKAYYMPDFRDVPLYREMNFVFGNDDVDFLDITKTVEYEFYDETGQMTGLTYPQAGDVIDVVFRTEDFIPKSGIETALGTKIYDLCDFDVKYLSIGGQITKTTSGWFTNSEDLTVTYDTAYVLPAAPEKEGYVFTGWYTDEACTKKYYGTTVTADTTLYAGYKKKTFTVTLNTDGATETTTVEYNEAASLPTKTKTGYNFLGWFLPDGTKYDGQAVTSDLTLTAKFEVIMLKVRFFVDGAEYKSVEVPYGSKFSEAVEKASLKQTSVKSVIRLASVAGEGEETPAVDQSLPEELTSDIKANVDVSAIDTAKEQTSNWFKATWEKIADFFVNLWAKISGFFVTAWEAVCNHFRNNWKWYAIGGGSAAGLAIVIAVICKVRR